jgi:hypothetical protein
MARGAELIQLERQLACHIEIGNALVETTFR